MSHTNHSAHSNTVAPRCTTVGTTFTKLSEAKTSQAYWNDLKTKINSVRSRWGLSTTGANDTYTPPVDSKVLASQWNTNIRDRLNVAPMTSFGQSALTASTSTALNNIGYTYDKAVDVAASKYCTTVCPSVCTSVHSSHTNHGSHGSHNEHSQHDAHSQHGVHSNHSQTGCDCGGDYQ